MGSTVYRGCCNKRHPFKPHIHLKSREIWLVHNLPFSYPMVLRLFPECSSDITVICAKYQYGCAIELESNGRTNFTDI